MSGKIIMISTNTNSIIPGSINFHKTESNDIANNDKVTVDKKKIRTAEKVFLEKLILDEMTRRSIQRQSKDERDYPDTIPPLVNQEFESKVRTAWLNNSDMADDRYDSIVNLVKLKNIAENLPKEENKKLFNTLEEKNIKLYLRLKPKSGAEKRKLKRERENAEGKDDNKDIEVVESIPKITSLPLENNPKRRVVIHNDNKDSTSSSPPVKIPKKKPIIPRNDDGTTYLNLKRNLKPSELLGGTKGVSQSIGRKLKTLSKTMSEIGELMDEKIKRRQIERDCVFSFTEPANVNIETIPQDIEAVDKNIKELAQQLMKQFKRKRELEIGKAIADNGTLPPPTMFMGNFTSGLGDTYLVKSSKHEVDETLIQLWNSRYENYQPRIIYNKKTGKEKEKEFKNRHNVFDGDGKSSKRKANDDDDDDDDDDSNNNVITSKKSKNENQSDSDDSSDSDS